MGIAIACAEAVSEIFHISKGVVNVVNFRDTNIILHDRYI